MSVIRDAVCCEPYHGCFLTTWRLGLHSTSDPLHSISDPVHHHHCPAPSSAAFLSLTPSSIAVASTSLVAAAPFSEHGHRPRHHHLDILLGRLPPTTPLRSAADSLPTAIAFVTEPVYYPRRRHIDTVAHLPLTAAASIVPSTAPLTTLSPSPPVLHRAQRRHPPRW